MWKNQERLQNYFRLEKPKEPKQHRHATHVPGWNPGLEREKRPHWDGRRNFNEVWRLERKTYVSEHKHSEVLTVRKLGGRNMDVLCASLGFSVNLKIFQNTLFFKTTQLLILPNHFRSKSPCLISATQPNLFFKAKR